MYVQGITEVSFCKLERIYFNSLHIRSIAPNSFNLLSTCSDLEITFIPTGKGSPLYSNVNKCTVYICKTIQVYKRIIVNRGKI